jgi:P4 family phage/plasmid primase-like protien
MKSFAALSSGTGTGSGNDYEQYMKQLYMKKGDPSMSGLSFTHTRIPSQEHGVSGGTFYIPQEKLPEFWTKYAKHVIVNRRHEYLTEKQLPGAGPVLIDLDFRYDPSLEKRQHTKEDVENVVGIYMDELSKVLDIQEGERRDIAVFVFEKPSMNTDDEKYTKDGIHIIIGVHADRVVQYMLRNNVLKKIPDVLKHLPLKNSWDDILDDNISRMVNPVGWQLYGSRKPGHEAYELKYHFNFTYIKSEVDTDLSDDYDCDGRGESDGDGDENESENYESGECDGDESGDENCKIEIKNKHKKNELWEWEYDEKNVAFFDYAKNFCLLSAQYDKHPAFQIRQSIRREYEEIKRNKTRRSPTNKIGGNIRRRVASSACSIHDITSREILTDEIDKLFHSLEPREHYVKETSDYTMCLPDKYYNQYSLWIRVGWAMRNTSDKLFLSWILFSSQSEKFSYDKISEFYEKWQTFSMENEDGLTRRSIVYWAQSDAKERYFAVYKKTIDYYVDITLSNDLVNMNGKPETTMVDLAVVLHNMFKNRFVCAHIKDNVWYEFENNRWVECDCGISLKQMISNEMYTLYVSRIGSSSSGGGGGGASGAGGGGGLGKPNKQIANAANGGNGNGNGTGNGSSANSEDGKPNQFQHRVSDICLKLKNTQAKTNIMKEAQELFYDKTFLRSVDTKTHLLCCNNCVIDFKEKRARKGQPDDYITKCTNIDYFALDQKKHGKIMAEINDFICKLYPEEEIRNYMWEHLASCLIGVNYPQTFNIYIGCGSNGKSKLVELMSLVLGEYKAVVPISLITSKRASIGGTSSEIAQLVGIRYAVMQEPSKGMRLEEGPMKEITSGDPVQGRALFKNMITFIPQFKLVVCTNTLLDVKANDEGTWRRIRKVDHKAVFCDNPKQGDPDSPYQFQVDKRLDEKFKIWAPVFLAMLVEKAYETGGMVKDAPAVLASSESYRNSQDYINEFVRDKIRKVEGHYVKKTEMYESFKVWYVEHYDRNVPRGNEIYEVFDKKYGKCTPKGWKNISIIYNHDEVEEE